MPDFAVWTLALNLTGFEVVQAEVGGGVPRVRLTVVPQVTAAVCPHCGGLSGEVHQTRDLDGVHDLPLADRAVELCVRVPQFWCLACERAFTSPLPGLACGTHATERFLARAAELIRHGDVRRAAAFLRVPEKTLQRWYYAWVEQQRDTTPALPITTLGIDELSLKKSTVNSSR